MGEGMSGGDGGRERGDSTLICNLLLIDVRECYLIVTTL